MIKFSFNQKSRRRWTHWNGKWTLTEDVFPIEAVDLFHCHAVSTSYRAIVFEVFRQHFDPMRFFSTNSQVRFAEMFLGLQKSIYKPEEIWMEAACSAKASAPSLSLKKKMQKFWDFPRRSRYLKHKYPVAHGILPSKPTEQLGEISWEQPKREFDSEHGRSWSQKKSRSSHPPLLGKIIPG